jgi:hypothetical protein
MYVGLCWLYMRLNLNLNTKHCAWDIDCPVYKKKISLKKKTIKYD